MSERRRQYYTDNKVQGYLLAALIIMELVLVIGLLFMLYNGVNQIIEDQLYVIHQKDGEEPWMQVVELFVVMMTGFVLVNLLALYVAHVIWGRYVKQTVVQFSTMLDKLVELDFSEVTKERLYQHHLIDLMQQWLLSERARNRAISKRIRRLERFQNMDIQSPEDVEKVKRILDKYRLNLIGK